MQKSDPDPGLGRIQGNTNEEGGPLVKEACFPCPARTFSIGWDCLLFVVVDKKSPIRPQLFFLSLTTLFPLLYTRPVPEGLKIN
jgi:hypothetical protein